MVLDIDYDAAVAHAWWSRSQKEEGQISWS